MRVNTAGLALSVGMGLLVLLMGLAVLSAAGLVSLADYLPLTEQPTPAGAGPASSAATSVAVAYTPASAEEADAIKVGDALFKNNCAQCHAVHDKVVGPALAGITKRRPIAWLVPWVKNSSKVIASGDEYATKLFNDHGKQQMPAFPQLSDKEIKSIITWITSQEGASAQPGGEADVVAAR